MIARFSILQLVGAALLWVAYVEGWLAYLVVNDQTHMTLGIGACFLIGLGCSVARQWTWAEWIREALPALGLLGTFIGFGMAVSGQVGAEYDLRDLGVATALNTTIIALIGNLWLDLTRMVCKP